MKKIIIIIILLFVISLGFSFASKSWVFAADLNETLKFTNPQWKITNPANTGLVEYITSPFQGIRLNCSQGTDVVLQFDSTDSYNGQVGFRVIEDSSSPNSISYLLILRDGVTGITVGARKDYLDYNNQILDFSRFFYSTAYSMKGTSTNSYVKRLPKNSTNIISLNATPMGGYAKINNINLAYLPSNKDDPQAVNIIYPVNYNLKNFKQIQVGCPWAGLNNQAGSFLLIENPKYTSLSNLPLNGTAIDRKTILTTLANNLLTNFPSLPDNNLSNIPSVAFGSNLPICDNNILTNQASFNTWNNETNARIKTILALARSYLNPKSEENYLKIKEDLQYAITYISPGDKGTVSADLALAYWQTANKYPEKKKELDTLIGNKLIDYSTQFMSYNPEPSQYIARSTGGLSIGPAQQLIVTGLMYSNQDWLNKGKCLLFHSTTKSLTETPSPSIPNCGYQTKTVFNGTENLDDVKLNLNNVGEPYDGKYENHNYSPHQSYVYGSLMGQFSVILAALQNKNEPSFEPLKQHTFDAVWPQNLVFTDFTKNLWNSTNINAYVPKDTPTPPAGMTSSKYYDTREYCVSYWAGFPNMFKKYSKSDNYLDPANNINGLIAGAVYYNDFSKTDELLKFLWYTGSDYGVIPFDTTLENIHPAFYLEQPHNTIRSLIFPATSLERYVLAAMLVDQNFSLRPLSEIKISGDLNKDAAVNILDLRHFLSNFLQTFTIFDYNKIVENFGK